jgi:hypothetical protein
VHYELRLNGAILGTSQLEHLDAQSGMVRGRFEPTPDYALVQPVFQLRTAARRPGGQPPDPTLLDRYTRARDRLPLEVWEVDGSRLMTTAIDIEESGEQEEKGRLELVVVLADRSFIEGRLG